MIGIDEDSTNTSVATGQPARPADSEAVATPRPADDAPAPKPAPPKVARAPAIIVTSSSLRSSACRLWYLVQPQPLIIQGEADATRIDIAARVDGRVGQRPVERGDNVAAGQLLFRNRQSGARDQAA